MFLPAKLKTGVLALVLMENGGAALEVGLDVASVLLLVPNGTENAELDVEVGAVLCWPNTNGLPVPEDTVLPPVERN